VDGACVDEAPDTGGATGGRHIAYTSHVHPLECARHAGHDGDNTRKVEDEISAGKGCGNAAVVGNVTLDYFKVEVGDGSAVITWKNKGTYGLSSCE